MFPNRAMAMPSVSSEALSTSAQNFTSLSFVPSDLNNPNSADILVSANSFGEVYSKIASSFSGAVTSDESSSPMSVASPRYTWLCTPELRSRGARTLCPRQGRAV